MAAHVYIHIPFCSYICSYCDFVKMVKIEKYYQPYLNELKNEIKSRYQNEKVSTLYIGGGTPSILSSREIIELGEVIKTFDLVDDYEFTFEANPDSLTVDKLHALREIGVNRLSIGVQTFNEKTLKAFNRLHKNEEVASIIKLAKSMGFESINVDLIYGYHSQSEQELKFDLEQFAQLDIEHISIYSLQIEDNSVFGKMGYHKVSNDLEADYYIQIKEYLENHQFKHYEISNFSKPGYHSKHNNCYWEHREYYGFGLGAHSFIDCQRITNTSSMENYINNEYVESVDSLNEKALIEEFMFLGLRKLEGVKRTDFESKFNKPIEFYYNDVIIRLEKKGLLETTSNIKLTEKGLLLANDVFMEFLID